MALCYRNHLSYTLLCADLHVTRPEAGTRVIAGSSLLDNSRQTVSP